MNVLHFKNNVNDRNDEFRWSLRNSFTLHLCITAQQKTRSKWQMLARKFSRNAMLVAVVVVSVKKKVRS